MDERDDFGPVVDAVMGAYFQVETVAISDLTPYVADLYGKLAGVRYDEAAQIAAMAMKYMVMMRVMQRAANE